MKEIINNLICDTDTADLIAIGDNWEGCEGNFNLFRMDNSHSDEAIYFLHSNKINDIFGEYEETISLLNKEEAKDYYEEFEIHVMDFQTTFDESPLIPIGDYKDLTESERLKIERFETDKYYR